MPIAIDQFGNVLEVTDDQIEHASAATDRRPTSDRPGDTPLGGPFADLLLRALAWPRPFSC